MGEQAKPLQAEHQGIGQASFNQQLGIMGDHERVQTQIRNFISPPGMIDIWRMAES